MRPIDAERLCELLDAPAFRGDGLKSQCTHMGTSYRMTV
jgi:hypothetical protein